MPRGKNGGKIEVTPRMIIAADLLAEQIKKGVKRKQKEALLKAGYTEKVAKTPSAVIDGKHFQALLRERLPVPMIIERHREMVQEAGEKNAYRYLELGYKLHGFLAPSQMNVLHAHVVKNVSWGDEEQKIVDIPPSDFSETSISTDEK